MGFPCSKDQAGINGRAPITGLIKFNFQLQTAVLSNSTPKEIETYAREEFKIPKDFPFLAYVPLDTQYWKLSHYPDQGLGINVELVTNPSRSQGWTEFRKGSELDVILW